ncbi:MAG: elongation factor P [Candidatus Cloacimonetes bacterium]|nr:elongation factor P [Candidatus Cloacimonadota bacterium]
MATTSDIRNGMMIEFKDGIYEIVEFLHVKPGKGNTFVRTKLRNIKSGQVLENNFRISEKLTEVRIEKSKKQYLYHDGDFFVFMDNDTYEQINIPSETIGELDRFLVENTEVVMKTSKDGEMVGIELPTSVIMEVTECDPNVKGNTASGGGKNARTQTGLRLTVPFFIEVGDLIKVDTRTGAYQERA